MKLINAGLDSNPFHTQDKPSNFITYRSQREAAVFLQQVYDNDHGLGVLRAPTLAGKTTVLRHFIEQLPSGSATAIVDGLDKDSTSLLNEILDQFGYKLEWPSIDELMNMVKVLAVQLASVSHAPLLVIENFHAMSPNTIHIIGQLAKLRFYEESALRIVLVSDCSLSDMMRAPAMQPIAVRNIGEHELGAMTCAETAYYLDAKLRSGGIDHPERVLPASVCDELFAESAGRPGLVDKYVLERLDQADGLPLVPQHALPQEEPVAQVHPTAGNDVVNPDEEETPRLTITLNGKTLATFDLDGPRFLIGRSNYNDITIDSTYLSRHHALLVRDKGVTVLVDLNSTNGTYVNSRRVLYHVLRHDDIISLGNHGLKLFDPACRHRAELDNPTLDQTVTMKALRDVRRKQTKEHARLKIV